MRKFLILFLLISSTCFAQRPTQAEKDSAKVQQIREMGLDTVRGKLDSFRLNVWAALLLHQHVISDVNGLAVALANRPTNQILQDTAGAIRTRLETKADALHVHNYASITGTPDLSPYSTITRLLDSASAIRTRVETKQDAGSYVLQSTTVNGQALSGNVTVSTITGNAGTATSLQNPRNINGVAFDGTANITIPITSSSTAIGYSSGAGSTVSQSGNKGSAVTLNKACGQITMVNAALAAAAEVSFTLNNNLIAANDVVVVSIKSGGTAAAYFVTVGSTAAGSCTITVGNVSAGSLSEALVLNFAIIKAVAN
jgi:hypothetical protein